MIITTGFRATKKIREIIKAYDEAQIMGVQGKCFLTGEGVSNRNYRVFTIRTSEGLKTCKFYLNPMYHTMCRGSIPFIEQKILREEAKQLIYTVTKINLNFRIKISGTRDGVKYNKLVGVTGLVQIIGLELANKLIERAFISLDDNVYCKLRTGLRVTFYSK